VFLRACGCRAVRPADWLGGYPMQPDERLL
jgi:hypothetical protein